MIRAAFLIPGDITLPTGGYAYDRQVLARLPAQGIDVLHVPLPYGYPAPSDEELAGTLAIVSGLEADRVLLIDGLAFGAMPADLVAAIRQPIVALVHHPLALEAGLAPARADALKDSERAALAHARRVITVSPSGARILAADFGVPPQSITVAVPGTVTAPRATGTGSPLALLSVGSIVPRKAYDVLVRALGRLSDRDWRLTIAGAVRSSDAHAALVAAIAESGLGGRVRLTGAVGEAELDGLYAAADVFVLSSLFEGYGMVLAEAMARGLPIVCTTGGAAAETCPDEAALKVPPGDAAALATALRRIIDDQPLRRRMAEASWRTGRALPDWNDTASTVAAVLAEVASTERSP